MAVKSKASSARLGLLRERSRRLGAAFPDAAESTVEASSVQAKAVRADFSEGAGIKDELEEDEDEEEEETSVNVRGAWLIGGSISPAAPSHLFGAAAAASAAVLAASEVLGSVFGRSFRAPNSFAEEDEASEKPLGDPMDEPSVDPSDDPLGDPLVDPLGDDLSASAVATSLADFSASWLPLVVDVAVKKEPLDEAVVTDLKKVSPARPNRQAAKRKEPSDAQPAPQEAAPKRNRAGKIVPLPPMSGEGPSSPPECEASPLSALASSDGFPADDDAKKTGTGRTRRGSK
jgi:hypothetical protein